MAFVIADRVKETTTTTGTGTVTLAGASLGYQSFAAIGNGNSTYYCIAGQTTNEWEVGIGTYTSSGTTLSRDTVLSSSNSGNLVVFSAGTKDVFVTYPSQKAIYDGGPLGTPSSGTVTNLTGTASININGTVGATTPNTGAFTTLSATGNVNFDGGTFVFNESGADKDFRVEGDTDDNLLFVDASTDRVGIGTNAPSYKFEVNGAIGFPSSTAPTWSFTIPTIYSNSSVLYLNSGLSFAFLTGTGAGTERVRINSTGIGIGTASPSKALDVVGAITASSDSSFTSTGALLISKGTAAEQPGSPVTGMLRYNTTSNQFEGYSGSSPAWNPVGGASISNDTSTASNLYPTFANATSGTATTIYTSNAKLLYKPSTGELQADVPVAGNGIFVNKTTINTSYTIASGTNGWSVGPITIASGVSVTIASGQKWLVG